ncbi:MAG TPA: hypothetical protein VHN11_22265 [Xanthobacteraceae bacterium]|jgi:hypothetical protein|nr:hypothetical protein [Xanthobacteraceae bacterium]
MSATSRILFAAYAPRGAVRRWPAGCGAFLVQIADQVDNLHEIFAGCDLA